jgi:long-chain acyl-CoA synthetase
MTAATMLEQEFGTVPDLIRAHAAKRPGHPALIHDDRVLDFAALDTRMDEVSTALQREGLDAGDAIAICAGTSIEYAILFFGALRAGVVVTPLAPSSTPESIVAMLADSGAKLFFLDRPIAEVLAGVEGDVRVRRIALDGSNAGIRLGSWLEVGAKPQPVAIQPEWPFNIIYSSGTTGAPKGIVHSHFMRWRHIAVARTVANGYGPDAITLISTPLYSNTTLVSFLPTLALGGTAVLMAKFDAQRYLALAEHHRVTHTMLVPVQYSRIMTVPDFGRYDLSSFRTKYCTSAPFAAALKADILARWPGGLVEVYGLTEGGGICRLLAHEFPDKLDTVGRPAPGSDIRLIDERGNEAPKGAIGEIVCHSLAFMNGYHNQPAKTEEAIWRASDGRRFLRTGDIGRFDDDGFLHLMDRKKDMIISGGFNIYPSDVELVMGKNEAVAEVAVVGVPSKEWGETPVAFVVLVPSASGNAPAQAEALKAWTNQRLGKTQRLAAVRIVESLPRSAIGKVLKRELRDAFLSEVKAAS